MQKSFFHERGFTLVEVIIVIALTMILASVSIASLKEYSSNTSHKRSAQVILGALEEAHARTLASDGDVAYGVHFDASMVVIFEGTTYTAGDPSNDERLLPVRTTITDISIGGGTEVFFTRLSGDASPTGTVTVSITDDVSINKVITIHESGLSEISN